MKTKNKIKEVLKYTDNELKKYVCEYVLNQYDTDEEIKSFFSDLSQHGCESGMVSSLIYHKDTHEFYNTFASEIDELKEELEDEIGEPLQIKGDVRNWLAWFGFEQMAYIISNEIDLS